MQSSDSGIYSECTPLCRWPIIASHTCFDPCRNSLALAPSLVLFVADDLHACVWNILSTWPLIRSPCCVIAGFSHDSISDLYSCAEGCIARFRVPLISLLISCLLILDIDCDCECEESDLKKNRASSNESPVNVPSPLGMICRPLTGWFRPTPQSGNLGRESRTSDISIS